MHNFAALIQDFARILTKSTFPAISSSPLQLSSRNNPFALMDTASATICDKKFVIIIGMQVVCEKRCLEPVIIACCFIDIFYPACYPHCGHKTESSISLPVYIGGLQGPFFLLCLPEQIELPCSSSIDAQRSVQINGFPLSACL